MRIRMIRRNLTRITEILRAVLFREPQHLGTRRRIQRLAQAARLALMNTLLTANNGANANSCSWPAIVALLPLVLQKLWERHPNVT